MSRNLIGIGVSPGIARGPVERLAPAPTIPADLGPADDPDHELQVTTAAIEATAADLDARSRRAAGAAADVLAAQVMMTRDPVLGDRMVQLIKEGQAAPTAVVTAFDEFRAQLSAAGPY